MMRKTFLWLAAISLLSLGAARAESENYYFVKMQGKASPLAKLSVNGHTVVSGTITQFRLPMPITSFLKSGQNRLEIEFTSDSSEGIAIMVEQRRVDQSERPTIARFSASANETKGRSVKRVVNFEAFPPRFQVALTAADKQQIRGQIQSLSEALKRKDFNAVQRLFEPAFQAEQAIYPEGVAMFRNLMQFGMEEMLKHPKFRMEPFRPAPLQFETQGDSIKVTRQDGKPILTSVEIVENETVIQGQDGKHSKGNYKSSMRMAMDELHFKRYNGRWHLTIGF
ncbi:MAG: hypothetical protein KIT45_05260 [Fimbriimonadia bacterium]|nr:hypothetical protein [Fimbriimonadia bacterium]